MGVEKYVSMSGNVALVTGGSGGIGEATCQLLASAGAHVLVHYNNHESKAQEIVENIRSSGGRADCVKANITNKDEVDAMVQSILKDYGRIDILINNAGIVRDRTLAKMNDEEWCRVIDVNLTGSYYCCSSVLPVMAKNGGGKIVFVSSIIGQRGGFGQCNYAASKAGVVGFAKSLALEVARKNIQVNCVAPGFTNTPMLTDVPEEALQSIAKQIPINRIAEPLDVAKTLLFLSSSMSDMVTGQVIAVNGGHYM